MAAQDGTTPIYSYFVVQFWQRQAENPQLAYMHRRTTFINFNRDWSLLYDDFDTEDFIVIHERTRKVRARRRDPTIGQEMNQYRMSRRTERDAARLLRTARDFRIEFDDDTDSDHNDEDDDEDDDGDDDDDDDEEWPRSGSDSDHGPGDEGPPPSNSPGTGDPKPDDQSPTKHQNQGEDPNKERSKTQTFNKHQSKNFGCNEELNTKLLQQAKRILNRERLDQWKTKHSEIRRQCLAAAASYCKYDFQATYCIERQDKTKKYDGPTAGADRMSRGYRWVYMIASTYGRAM